MADGPRSGILLPKLSLSLPFGAAVWEWPGGSRSSGSRAVLPTLPASLGPVGRELQLPACLARTPRARGCARAVAPRGRARRCWSRAAAVAGPALSGPVGAEGAGAGPGEAGTRQRRGLRL